MATRKAATTKKKATAKKKPAARAGKKSPRGRKCRLETEDGLQENLLDWLRRGNYRRVAAEGNGVNEGVFARWMAEGETDPASVQGKFREAVLEAENEAHDYAVRIVLNAALKDPRSAQWYLERKFPEEWGRKDRVTSRIEGPDGGAVKVDFHGDTKPDNDTLAVLAILADSGALGAGAKEEVASPSDAEVE